jgi:epoxide hydrolase-like predicted phosphatase
LVPHAEVPLPIKAVVFDVGGVLERVEDDAWPKTWLRSWERRMNLPAGHVLAALADHEPLDGIVTGAVSEQRLREVYARALGLDDVDADAMMAQMWDHYCGELDIELRDFASRLRPRYTTAILSNSADGARREEQRRHGLEDLVDLLVYSHEVGLAKPDPAIYRLTEERLGVDAHEIVFLDDRDDNVRTAVACGWRAVLHADTATSIREVTRLLEAD